MRRAAFLFWFFAAACLPALAASAQPLEYSSDIKVIALERAGGIAGGLSPLPGDVVAVDGTGARWRVDVTGTQLRLAPGQEAVPPATPRAADALPDGEVTQGMANIRKAWLTGPTRRYAHGVLGDPIEASGVAVMRADSRLARFELGPQSVFEDRRARLFDLDGDGADEIIVVQSFLGKGASLTVLDASGGDLSIAAATPPVGFANRWLNPAGAADFDGDGRIEIAYVETPHIGGTLKLVEYRDGRLVAKGQADGFSNHAIGSRVQDQAAVIDWNGDGVADLALPDARRQALRIVTFAGGRFRELARFGHTQPIASALWVTTMPQTRRAAIIYALADGSLRAVSP